MKNMAAGNRFPNAIFVWMKLAEKQENNNGTERKASTRKGSNSEKYR